MHLKAMTDKNKYYNTIPDPYFVSVHDEIYNTAEESGYEGRSLFQCEEVGKY